MTPRGDDANNGTSLAKDMKTVEAAVTAIGGPGRITLGRGNIIMAGTAAVYTGMTIEGAGQGATIVSYAGTGTAFTSAAVGVRTFNQRFSGFTLTGPGKVIATKGLVLDSMTDASVRDVLVSQFGTGVSLPSAVNGGTVYNQLDHVTVSSCTTGFLVGPMGSNTIKFYGCRANACTIGLDILDANHVYWSGGAFEVNITGVRITATQNAFADFSTITGARFESNGTAWNVTSSFVRDTMFVDPGIFAAYVIIDNGTRTSHIGNFAAQSNVRKSA